jgi:hypothetical protein
MTATHQGRELTADTVDRLLVWTIAAGCAGFIFILVISALWDHSIILLHAFQSLQYLVVVALAARRNRWGYFIGIAVAGLWDYGGLFVNSFVASGWRALSTTIETGVLTKPDQIIAVFGFTFHLMIIVACALAYLRLANRKPADGIRLLVSFAGAIGYFYAIIALFQPRYLSFFSRLLHPHGF